jgi:prepilin-type processing-associated H-X9-DG protein
MMNIHWAAQESPNRAEISMLQKAPTPHTNGTPNAPFRDMEMQMRNARRVRRTEAFSLLELISVLFVVACLFVFFVLPPQPHGKAKAPRINCVNNLKNVGFAFRLYANDHADRFPWETTNATPSEWPRWTALNGLCAVSNELSTPRVALCPADNRKEATNWNICAPTNISYFIGLDSSPTIPESFLAGDRNLMTNGVAFTLPRAKIPPAAELSWTRQIHQDQGNVCMGDGSVEQHSNARVRQ